MKAGDIETTVNNIKEFASNYGSIYIYGAGKYAQAFSEVLRDYNINIEGFCVSHYEDFRKKVIVGIKTVAFDDILNFNCGFMLAMKAQYQEEVCKIFKASSKSIQYLSIDENFLKCAVDYAVNKSNNHNIKFYNILEYQQAIEQISKTGCLLVIRRTAMGDVLALTSVLKKLRTYTNIPICIATKWVDIYNHNMLRIWCFITMQFQMK